MVHGDQTPHSALRKGASSKIHQTWSQLEACFFSALWGALEFQLSICLPCLTTKEGMTPLFRKNCPGFTGICFACLAASASSWRKEPRCRRGRVCNGWFLDGSHFAPSFCGRSSAFFVYPWPGAWKKKPGPGAIDTTGTHLGHNCIILCEKGLLVSNKVPLSWI